jgi:lipoprotein-anchoring transpeptidase ErfK/SrfK
MWIDLSERTYGLHGTPEPSQLFEKPSHCCVRLTNWDANELADMVDEGTVVEFEG